MGLYPEILFHFTKKQNLYDIWDRTFKVSYARERITGLQFNVSPVLKI